MGEGEGQRSLNIAWGDKRAHMLPNAVRLVNMSAITPLINLIDKKQAQPRMPDWLMQLEQQGGSNQFCVMNFIAV